MIFHFKLDSRSAFVQIFLWVLLLIGPEVTFAQQQVPVNIKYDNGLKIKIADPEQKNKTELVLAGRIHYDITLINQDDAINSQIGSSHSSQQFRRIFLMHSGNLFYGKLNYKIQFDFTGGQIGFRDVYIEPRIFSAGKMQGFIRAGQFKDPFRLENMFSSNNLSLMERSYISGFAPLRNTGIMYHMHTVDEVFTFQLAYLDNSTDAGADLSPDDGYNITTRATFLPVHNEEQTIHLGAAFSVRERGMEAKYNIKAKPPVSTLANYLSVPFSGVEDVQLLNFEGLLIRKRLMIMSELLLGSVRTGTDHHANAYYGQVSYFINRDSHHRYNNSLLGIKDVISDQGAWELVARYAAVHIDDEIPAAPSVHDLTFGLNYYFNEQLRIMLNLTRIHLQSAGNTHALSLRLQATF